jgi:hypothetical protein
MNSDSSNSNNLRIRKKTDSLSSKLTMVGQSYKPRLPLGELEVMQQWNIINWCCEQRRSVEVFVVYENLMTRARHTSHRYELALLHEFL